MNTTAEVFNRFGLALQGTGRSAQELLRVTELVNKAVTISGASAESARAAIIQFGQGLASGQLRGQELNSVLEQTPRLARAIADNMQIPFGRLREAAQEGLLTTEAILNAVKAAGPELDKEFKLIQKTVGSVMGELQFQISRALDKISKQTGFSKAIIGGIEAISRAARRFADDFDVRSAIIESQFVRLSVRIRNIVDGITGIFGGIFTTDFDPDSAAENLKIKFEKFKSKVKEFLKLDDILKKDANGKLIGIDFSTLFNNFIIPEDFKERFKEIETTITTFVENIKKLYKALFGKTIAPDYDKFAPKPISFTLTNATETKEQEGLLDRLLTKLTEFSSVVLNLFETLNRVLTPVFDVIKERTEAVSSSITTTLSAFGGHSGVISGVADALSRYASSISKILELDKIDVKSFSERIFGSFGDNTDFSKDIIRKAKQIEETVFGKPVGPAGQFREDGLLQRGYDFAKDNKGLLATTAAGTGLAIVFPQTTLAALKLAGIGLGLAAVGVINTAFSKGIPILLTFAGYQFLVKDISNDPEAQERTRAFAQSFTEGIKNAITGADKEAGASIINDIGTFLQSLGEGIIDGIFDVNFENKFVEAFAGALFVSTLVLVGTGRIFGVLASLGSYIAGVIFGGGLVTNAIISGLTLGLIDAKGNEKIKAEAKLFGAFLLRSIFSVFTIDFLGDILKEELENFQIKLGVDKDEIENGTTGIFNDLAVGFSKGVTAALVTGARDPRIVVAFGIGGALFEALSGQEMIENFKNLGKNLYEGFTEKLPAIFGGKGKTELEAGLSTGNEIIKADLQSKLLSANETLLALNNEASNLNEKIANEENPLAISLLEQKMLRVQQAVQSTTEEVIKLTTQLENINKVATPEDIAISNATSIGIPGVTTKAAGGFIRGAGGPTDDKIPTMLSNGEYVVRASAVDKFGVEFLDAVNRGVLPQRRANGGLITTERQLLTQENPLETGLINVDTIYKRLKQVEPYYNQIGGATTDLRDKARFIASAVITGNAISKSRELYYPDPLFPYLREFSVNNRLGEGGNANREIITDPFKFITPKIYNPLRDEYKLVPEIPNIITNRVNLRDFIDISSIVAELLEFSQQDIYDLLGVDFSTYLNTVGFKVHDLYSGGQEKITYNYIDDLIDIKLNFEDIIRNLLRSQDRSFSQFGFDSLDSALTNISGYDSETLRNHAFDILENTQSIYRSFFGKNLSIIEDAYPPGDNAHFWKGRNASDDAHIALMSFNTADPFKFITAYYAAIHEAGHAIDFLKDTANFKDMTKWPKRNTSFESDLLNETDANIFARDNSLVNLNPKVLDASVAFSQVSYINKWLAKALKENKDILKENPAIFSVLKEDYNFDIKDILGFGEEYSRLFGRKEFMTSNELDINQSDLDYAKELWEESLLPAIKNAMFSEPTPHKESFDVGKIRRKRSPIIKKFALGGYVTGEGGPKDDKIPALLSNREFVVNAEQTSKFRPILEAINSGMIKGFENGSGVTTLTRQYREEELAAVEDRLKMVNNQLRVINNDILSGTFTQKESDDKLKESRNTLEALKSELLTQKDTLKKSIDATTDAVKNQSKGKAKLTPEQETLKARRERQLKMGEEAANEFRSQFERSFSEALKTGDFKQMDLIDMFTANVVDSFAQGVTDSLFEGLTGEKGALTKLFGSFSSFGGDLALGSAAKIGEGAEKETPGILANLNTAFFSKDGFFGKMFSGIGDGINMLLGQEDGAGLGGMISKIPQFFGGITESLSGGIQNLFKGLQGAQSGTTSGGTSGSSGNMFLDIAMFALPFFLNDGGIVPRTPYSKEGVDSVPAMLTPGELVVPADKVNALKQESSTQSVVNLNITGDISRQTRKEIIGMLPTIAQGVNAQNKERNFKYS